MKNLTIFCALSVATLCASAQTLNVKTGQVTYQFAAEEVGEMPYGSTDAVTGSMVSTVTMMNKVFNVADIDQMYVDDTEVLDDGVWVNYAGETATVRVSGNIAANLTIRVDGAHVAIVQDANVKNEIVYELSGSSENGSFYMDGQLKVSLLLNGLTLHNPDSAAINIRDGKRISVELAEGTVNTLSDGPDGTQKACFMVKGHTELKSGGQLYITGNTGHAFWGKEYVEVKKTCGGVHILGAVGDGFNVNQYFQQNGGTVTVKGIGDDAIQVSYKTDDDDAVIVEDENTGSILIKGGTLEITTTGNANKGLKAEGNIDIQDGDITVTQSGSITVSRDDLSYSTAIRSDADVTISGGTVNIVNTADGGKGISAEGNVNIDASTANCGILIQANGAGGTAETTSDGTAEPAASYRVFVSLPTSGSGGGPGGGGNAWSTLYLYQSDGTLVQQLSATVSKSSGYSSATFYYYDFKTAVDGSYYFQSANYNSRGTTYVIRSATFSAPTSGEDVYYSISSSYSTSGTTRTYKLTNVTSTYSGSTDVSEDQGTGYNAVGIKADGNLTIGGGVVIVENSGAMSKSLKSKATITINGGDITLVPSGDMKVINNDASYSSGIKAVDFVMNDGAVNIQASGSAGRGVSATNITTNGGTLTVNSSSGGVSGTSDDYTAKGLLADTSIALNAGVITVTMTGDGGKGIKSKGTYTQGLSDGAGPTLTVSTSGSRFGSSSSTGGGNPWGGGMQESSGGSAKAIKITGVATLLGGETYVSTATDGAEGLETKQGNITISGGHHYFKCYDDCINTAYQIKFNGGITVCYSTGNDAIDSNYGRSQAITIGNGCVVAYTTAGGPEEAFDCDNNSYISITGNGYALGAGASQGGGGGWGGSSSSSIGSATQGYALLTSSLSYSAGRYYAICDDSSNVLFTYSLPTSVTSTLSLITAKGMTKGSKYYLKYSTTAPTDATDSFQGIYLGNTLSSLKDVTNFTAQ